MCRKVQGSQIFKQNWIISICSRVIVILLISVSSALGVGQVGGGCLGWSAIVYMSSGMFRGKESSNRIELSQLVQDLLNFGVLGFWQLWGWVDGVGVVGGVPTHVHMHAHAHAHTRTCGKHDNFTQMATPIGGIPGNSLWCHTHVCVCVCMCMHACAHMWGHPLTTPYPHLPTPPPPRGTPESVKIQ